MSQVKPSSAAPTESQLWTLLRNQLASIATHHVRLLSTLSQTNSLQTALEKDTEPYATLRPQLEQSYEQIRKDAGEENATISVTMDNLAALIALKTAPEPASVPLEKKDSKKRKLDASSGSPAPESPLPTPASVPLSASTSAGGGSLSARPPSINISAARNASPGPMTPGIRSKTPRLGGKEAHLYDGRSIAFKTPPAKGRPIKDVDKKRIREEIVEGGTWILARIVRCVDKERGRYEVQDVDDENGAAALYVTTAKSIIPLPDPKNKDTFPPPFKVGTEVLAVYPDVTALYRGRVREAPSTRSNTYSVVFEGDQGATHPRVYAIIAFTSDCRNHFRWGLKASTLLNSGCYCSGSAALS